MSNTLNLQNSLKSKAKAVLKSGKVDWLYKIARNIYRPTERTLNILMPGKPFTAKGIGLQFDLNPGGYIESQLFWYGIGKKWERQTLRAWAYLSKSAAVIYDVGANTGVFSLVAQAANSTAHIVAFEPVERLANRIEANALLNGFPITVRRSAIADRDGATELCVPESVEIPYSASIAKNYYKTSSTRLYKVEQEHLDKYKHLKPELVKIDVEGAEIRALKGAQELIKSNAIFLVEISRDNTEDDIQWLNKTLTDNKMVIYENFNEDHFQQISAISCLSTPYKNYLFVPFEINTRAIAHLVDQSGKVQF